MQILMEQIIIFFQWMCVHNYVTKFWKTIVMFAHRLEIYYVKLQC